MTQQRADTAKGDTTLSPVKQLRESKDSNALLKAQLERANAERIGLMHSLNQETLARKQGEKMNRELSKQLHSPQQKTAEVELELVLTELQSEKRKLELLRGTLTPVGASVSPMPAPRSPTASPARAARSVERRAPSQPNNEELAEGMASSVAGLALGQYTAAEHRAAVMTEALHELQAPHCAADPNPVPRPPYRFLFGGCPLQNKHIMVVRELDQYRKPWGMEDLPRRMAQYEEDAKQGERKIERLQALLEDLKTQNEVPEGGRPARHSRCLRHAASF